MNINIDKDLFITTLMIVFNVAVSFTMYKSRNAFSVLFLLLMLYLGYLKYDMTVPTISPTGKFFLWLMAVASLVLGVILAQITNDHWRLNYPNNSEPSEPVEPRSSQNGE